jgi:hypothetical protein
VIGSAPTEPERPPDAYRPPLMQHRELLGSHRSDAVGQDRECRCRMGSRSVVALHLLRLWIFSGR